MMYMYKSLLFLLASVWLSCLVSVLATSSADRCIFKPQRVKVARDNCTGTFLAFSCAGHCHSYAVPKVYYSREDIPPSPPPNVRPIYPYNRDCDCCTAQTRRMREVDVDLYCEHNKTNVTIQQYAATATRCGCAKCEYS